MRPVRRLLLGFAVLSLLLACHTATADITPIAPRLERGLRSLPTGGAAAPNVLHQTIRMDSEEVTIILRKDRYTVDAVFHMLNTGETTREWVGFPKRGRGTFPSFDAVSEFIRFDCWIDGKKAQLAEQRDVNILRHFVRWLSAIPPPLSKNSSWIEDSRWMMGHVSFLGHAKTMINVRYDAKYASGGYFDHAYYIYGTGRNWKDSIGKACFTVDCTQKKGADRVEVNFSKPDTEKYIINRKLISQNFVKYEISDFEPDPDGLLSIHLDSRLTEDDDDETVLVLAAVKGREDLVKTILDKGIDPNGAGEGGDTPLMAASQRNYPAIVTLLLERGADINAKGKNDETPLIAAARAGQLSMVKLLVDRGADINSKGKGEETPLTVAVRSNQLSMVKLLLDNGADISARDSQGRTALNWAVEGRNMDLAQLLRDWGATVTLDVAARLGDLPMVEHLIEQGADVNKRDHLGRTALMYAAERGHAAVVRLLLDNGADPNAKDKHNGSPFTFAARTRGGKGRHLDVVRVLLESGADPGIRDEYYSRSVLVAAVEAGRIGLVKALLDKQVDVNAKDAGGRTALDIARIKGHTEIEQLLLVRGAKKEYGK